MKSGIIPRRSKRPSETRGFALSAQEKQNKLLVAAHIPTLYGIIVETGHYKCSTTGNSDGREALSPNKPNQRPKTLFSPLIRLPPEILDLILSFLPRETEQSLRLPCSDLYHRDGSQSMLGLIHALRLNIDSGVRQRSRWMCNSWIEQHIQPRSLITTLACYPCRTRHSKLFFSKEEATNLSSGKRSCQGWTKRLDVSPRCRITFQHISEARQKCNKTGFQKHIPSRYHEYLRTIDDTVVNDKDTTSAVQAVQGFDPSTPEIKMTRP